MSFPSNKSQEPSMEEVLASIRRIISEEMDKPSRSAASPSDGQPFEFPWSQSSAASQTDVADKKLAQTESVQNGSAPAQAAPIVHPFMPAQPAVAPQTTPSNGAPQTGLSNADFLSSYFAEIAEQKSVQGEPNPSTGEGLKSEALVFDHGRPSFVASQPVTVSAPVEVKPVTQNLVQDHPFAGIIPLRQVQNTTPVSAAPQPVAAVVSHPAVADVSSMALAPVQVPLVQDSVLQAAPAVQPVRPSPIHVADAMMAAFIQANLLPTAPAPSLQEATRHETTVQEAVVQDLAIQEQVIEVQIPVVEQPTQEQPIDVIAEMAPIEAEEIKSPAPIDHAVIEEEASVPSEAVSETAPEPSGTPMKGLMSDHTASVFAASLSNMTQSIKSGHNNGAYPRLDEFVAELMKPLVVEWMDQNLERIVEEAVRDEIKRVSKLART